MKNQSSGDALNLFEITEEISAPPEKVWKIMADVEHWPEWTASVRRILPLAPGPIGLGAKYRIIQPKLAPLVWRVTDFEPGNHFTWEAKSPGIKVVGEHWISPSVVPGKVMVRLVVRQEGLLAPLLDLCFGKLTRHYVDMEAKGLRRRSETPL